MNVYATDGTPLRGRVVKPAAGTPADAPPVVDIGEHCTHCGTSVAIGSGSYVNRIPSGAYDHDTGVELDGFMCADCQCVECDECGQATLDYAGYDGRGFICDDCAETLGLLKD